ncbi:MULTISPECIES: major capsid protein [Enterococcus]|uniref:major capsid protein n=1 Tax=Enterococcus TaxID=1350 RepID=UPI0034DD9FF5
MPKIDEIYNTAVVLDYTKDVERDYTLGDALFPETKIDDIELEFIKGGNGLPIAASVHAWDSETEIADREGFDLLKMELAPVKRKIRLNGKDSIKLKNPRTNTELKNVLAKLFDDAAKMVESVRTRFEAMRFEAIATGKVTFDENGYKGTLDYKVPADHKEVVAVPWSDPASKPMDDLKKWQSKIKADTGTNPTRVLTSERVALLLEDHASIRLAIKGNANQMVTRAELNTFLASKGLPVIATEDRSYRVRKGNGYEQKRFFDENTLSLFPEGPLGELVYGITEEESILSEDSNIDMTKVGNIVTTVEFQNDPPGRWTKAAAVALPSFPVADQVFIATGLIGEETEETPEG